MLRNSKKNRQKKSLSSGSFGSNLVARPFGLGTLGLGIRINILDKSTTRIRKDFSFVKILQIICIGCLNNARWCIIWFLDSHKLFYEIQRTVYGVIKKQKRLFLSESVFDCNNVLLLSVRKSNNRPYILNCPYFPPTVVARS